MTIFPQHNFVTAVRLLRIWLVLEPQRLAFAQPIAFAMGLVPGLRSAVRALTPHPQSLVNYAD